MTKTLPLKAIALRLERCGWKEHHCSYFGGYASVEWRKGNRIVRWVKRDGDTRAYVGVRNA